MKIYEYVIRMKDFASEKIRRLAGVSSGTNAQLSGLQAQSNSTGSSLASLANYARGAALAIGIALATAVVGLSKQALTLAADLEQTTVGFEVMLGSADKANKMVADLRRMAKFTPFETTDLVRATETMLGFGIAGEKILPTLNMLGDVSRGNADKLRLITLAYSQIQSAGRLMGQDLLQLINAGFNPLQEISKKTGKSMAQLKKDMEDGAISSDMVTDAFRSATSEGGRFFEMMERQSKTFHGMASTLRDEWNEGLTELGQRILPSAIKGLQWMRSIVFDLFNRVDFSALLTAFRDTWNSLSQGFEVFSQFFQILGISTSQVDGLQMAVNYLAFAFRNAFLPIRIIILAFQLLIDLVRNGSGVLQGFGEIMVGIFTRDFSLISQGIVKTKESFNQGFDEMKKKVLEFGKTEYEGYKQIFTTKAKPAQQLAASAGSSLASTASALTDRGADKKTKDGIDKITGGGKQSVNVTINLESLIGTQNFDVKNVKETIRDMEKDVVEALLRVLNSGNYAASQ